MYSKLGDLLKSAIEEDNLNLDKEIIEDNQEVSSEKEKISLNDKEISDEDTIKLLKNREKILKKKEIPLGKLIKVYKYANNIHFPDNINQALSTLDIVYPFSFEDIKKKYHTLIKIYHPDKNTIHKTDDVDKNRQIDINKIIDAYKILDNYFNV